MYIENIFVLIAIPLIACLFCVKGRPRRVIAGLLVGMTACLLSAYVSSFFAEMVQLDAVRASVEIAPSIEEIAKLLPLVFYLVVFAPDEADIDLSFIMVAVGFATMESAFYLGESGLSNPAVLLLRGLGASMMHVSCGVVMGFALTHVWKRPWLRIAGTFGLLCLAATYHGLFNLLIVADGLGRIAAIVMPLVIFTALLVVRHRRQKRELDKGQNRELA